MSVYNRIFRYGVDDLASFDLRVLLLKSSYTFDADHDFVSDLVPASNELSDASYARKTITGETSSIDDTNDRGKLDFDDITWTALAGGESIAHAIFYRFVTNDSDSELLWRQAISPARTTNGNDFKLIVNAIGAVLYTEGSVTLPSGDIVQAGTVALSGGAATVSLSPVQADTAYRISVDSDADEVIRWGSKTTTSFTITSSNGSSTANVDYLVVRV